jgi:hypothetical protein
MTTAVYLGIGVLSQGWTLAARDLSQYSSRGNDPDLQHRQLKTAPELERLILIETRRHAICFGVAAVTVREVSGGRKRTGRSLISMRLAAGWRRRTKARLQQEYELLPEFAFDMDF